MSSAALTLPPAEAVVRRPRPPVWTALAAGELRRLVLHPLVLGSLALVATVSLVESPGGPRDAYHMVTGGAAFLVGPLSFFAANLVASRARRHGAVEWLSALPATRRSRTAAVQVACAGPALLLAAATVPAYAALAGRFPQEPHLLELLSGPLTVLGGGLLGVLVARWAPFPGAAALVMVGLVTVHLWLAERAPLLGAYVEFPRWGRTAVDWAGVIDGSRGWHVAYLAALCAMAVVGALLVDTRRRLPLFLLGVGVTGCAVLAGWAQLP